MLAAGKPRGIGSDKTSSEGRRKRKAVREPWDLLRGLDVFRDRGLLVSELNRSVLRHWAPNCSTFSRARERPIPGVRNPPKPLRNDLYPEGIPEVMASLPASKRRKVELDTDMVKMAVNDCIQSHKTARYFSLEHPRNSIARRLGSWERLEGMRGVCVTEYHACMFSGCKRRKAQVLIHNIPGMDEKVGKLCAGDKRCTRTGQPHLPWKPLVKDGRVTAFPTGEEREYSEGFCEAYAEGLTQISKSMGDKSFIEIFSGPNAPLSRAVARAWDEPEPKRLENLDRRPGVLTELAEMPDNPKTRKGEVDFKELQHASKPGAKQTSERKDPGKVFPETNPYRVAAVQAAKQPSYGKRIQLIEDGLNSPTEHLETAKGLKHPFDCMSALKDDHKRAVQLISSSPRTTVERRFEALDKLKAWAEEMAPAQAKANKRASWTARKLGLKPQTELMKRLQSLLEIEDTAVPDHCLQGLKITGPADESNFFEPFETPPVMSTRAFHDNKMARSMGMIERVEYMARKGSPQLAEAIWKKTMKEVSKGTMGPPMTLTEVRRKYADDFQITPSFGLAQGADEKGEPKYRRIDDHTASGVNQFSKRMQKVPMAMIDYVGVMVRAVAQSCNSVIMSTEDMQGAYRQVPLHPSDVRYAVTGVFNPVQKEVSLFEMYGQPLGAGHAVPNFCRVSEWICRFLQRFFHLHVEHFFDDFFIIESQDTIQSGVIMLREGFKILGFTLDPDKSQTPTISCPILGVLFSSAVLSAERRLIIQAKPTRLANLKLIISQVLQTGELSSALAGSIVGKFGFLCSTLFGKVGRCCTGALRHRQYSLGTFKGITPQLRASLLLMLRFLEHSPSRELRLNHSNPILLDTDASDVPGRTPQRLVGSVLYDPIDNALLYSSWAVSQALVDRWIPKKTFMNQLELLAAPVAFTTWQDRLTNRSILLWVDNDGAASSLVKGYSPKGDSAEIVGEFWILVASMKSHVYIDRVESKSNIADGPSRDDYSLLRALHGTWCSPKLGTFGDLSPSTLSGFGTPNNGGRWITQHLPHTTGGEIVSRVYSLGWSWLMSGYLGLGMGSK